MRVRLEIFPRPDLLDAQSRAVLQAVHAQGFAQVQALRVGRCIDLELAVASRTEAQAAVEQLAEALLVHPVTEDWRLRWPDDDGDEGAKP